MSQLYYGLVTTAGLAKLAAAAGGGPSLTLASMAFGDGGGAETAPTSAATALVNERYRAAMVEKYPHPTNPSILYVEGVIPPGVGGWTMREAGIYDTDGTLIVIAKTPAINVALVSEGASTEGVVRLPIVFDTVASVQILVDPTVLLATQGWVLERVLSRPFITVDSATVTAPPANPAAHALYLVPAGATGAWAGQTHKLAYYSGGWRFFAAPVAKQIAASDTGRNWRRTATGWEPLWVEDEVATLLARAGIAAPHSADQRVTRAIRSMALNHVPVGGTANALTVTLNPAPASYDDLRALWIVPVAANAAGPVTININGLGPVPVTQRGAVPPAATLLPGIPSMLARTATGYEIVGSQTTGTLLNRRIITASGSYTPSAGTRRIFVVCQAGGGAGGGVAATASTSNFGGGAGGGPGEARTIDLNVTDLSVPVTVTVGAGGAAVNGGGGGAGGSSSFGPHCTAVGGGGGTQGAIAANVHTQHPGAGGTGGAGGIGFAGQAGAPCINISTTNFVSGAGGASYFGGGGNPRATGSGAGFAAPSYGAGGGGAGAQNGAGPFAGGAGGAGVVIIEEYA